MASSYGEDASKSALREGYLAIRDRIAPSHRERLDAEIRAHLLALPTYAEAQLLLSYVPFRDEIDTRPIMERAWADGKRVALPRCVPGSVSLQFFEVTSLDGLRPGARGALEPPAEGEPLTTRQMLGSVCLVPGLVFDADGYRIGYGAGYYDNFLAVYPGTKVGLAHSMQVSGNPLPADEHDIAVDVLVSDGAVWSCRRW
ncbi:5-formyltetrahydrofolate cyclo-ligase [Olsenella phocaeensis]|uniref:5-formyltetrahydrofolate cyclo-ligase n=1 Tax=Olsenella phocaeensis TaxID=1852385 RepID=UPI003A93DF6A